MRDTLRAFTKLSGHLRQIVNQESYFSDGGASGNTQKKSKLRIAFELYLHAVRHGEVDEFYFAYGKDYLTRRQMREYVPYREFRIKRNLLNLTYPVNYICLLRDKDIFGRIMTSLRIPITRNIAIIKQNRVLSEEGEVLHEDLEQFVRQNAPVFIKQVNGECGDGVFSVCCRDGALSVNGRPCDSLSSKLDGEATYVVQPTLVQHPELSRLYPQAVNTLRIITVRNPEGEIEIFSTVLRVGVHGNQVDNWALGGLSFGVKEDGRLTDRGFYKPGHGTVQTSHPDTHVVFGTFRIPFCREAKELCIKAHNALKGIHSIGWDVAITEHGPILIEGNDNWEISLIQVCNGGVRESFDRLFRTKKHGRH